MHSPGHLAGGDGGSGSEEVFENFPCARSPSSASSSDAGDEPDRPPRGAGSCTTVTGEEDRPEPEDRDSSADEVFSSDADDENEIAEGESLNPERYVIDADGDILFTLGNRYNVIERHHELRSKMERHWPASMRYAYQSGCAESCFK